MSQRIQVFGPAYLDRVVLVDGPLVDPGHPPLDQSVDGSWKFGVGLTLEDPDHARLSIELPADYPGPFGTVALSRPLRGLATRRERRVQGRSWHDDLGGMGAGFAAAFRGVLFSALGSEEDPMSQEIAGLLTAVGVTHRPIRVTDRPADWTLLITSGPHGDKLPIGFRGCHAAIQSLAATVAGAGECDLRVVASFPNRLAAEALAAPGARIRMFAPAMRNMIDVDPPVSRFAEAIDIFSCNRSEWESLPDREQVAWQVSILSITDGAHGALVRFTTPTGEPGLVEVPAFPRARPPRDTNRAGEAYASTLVQTLLDAGWSGPTAEPSLVERAAQRASVAAALVLDRADFGFATHTQIDEALHIGRVA